MTRERENPRGRARAEEKRVERVPMYEQRDRLGVPIKKGWQRRWVIDHGNRIERLKLAGWRVVEDPNLMIGDERVKRLDISGGSAVVTMAGENTDERLVLMETRQEYFDADQKHKQGTVDAEEQDMFRQLNPGTAHAPGFTDGTNPVYGHSGPTGKRIRDPREGRIFGRK